jgi:hypothetical protein
MNISIAVLEVASKFVYKPDRIRVFDSWKVMRGDTLYGDCDNFALTAVWYACDRSMLKFIWNVILLHKYRFWFCKTESGEKHVVGYAQGKFFDNFSNKALPKQEFFELTKHKRIFVYPSPFVLVYMFIGIFI